MQNPIRQQRDICPIEKSSASKKPERQIPTGHRFSNKKTTTVLKNNESESSVLAVQASVFMAKTSVHISLGLVLHQMTSDHNRSELGIQDHSNEHNAEDNRHSMDVQMKGKSNKTATANTNADGTLEIQATLDTIRQTSLSSCEPDQKDLWEYEKGFLEGQPRTFIAFYLLPAMLLVATTNPNAGQEHDVVPQSQPSSSTPPVPSTSSPPVHSPPPIPASIPTPTPIPETEPEPFEHTFEEPSPVHQHFSPPQEQAQGQLTVDDLLQVVPQLISRIDSLETDLKQTKLTMGNAIVKLVKKVKKLEGFLKRRNMVLSDSEEEEPEAQGRKSQDDPLDSLVQGLVTPSTTKVNASGEEQVEDISPNTLEAAKTLSRVASLKPKSIDKGRRYKRRKETKGKKVVSSLVFQEEVDTGAKEVNTAEGVNTGSIKLSTVSEQVSTGSAKRSIPSPDKGQRAGKAPMIIEETPKKSKEQILQ
ncbi:hypothetical protein Tco_0627407 [Tanacetum coccineum]|uniref:Uncharacterized protein n=1 Tax=Tanacetum coccineum TaxID=301880 RepID=A0ABQ4WMA8_9ASTR